MAWYDRLADELLYGAQEQYVAELSAMFVRNLARGVDNPDRYKQLISASESAASELLATYAPDIQKNAAEAVESALISQQRRIDADLASAYPNLHLASSQAATIEEAKRQISSYITNSNVALKDEQLALWREEVANAIVRADQGAATEDIVRRAVERLSDAGLTTIDWESGYRRNIESSIRTVASTSAVQARNNLVFERCEEFGHDLVMTSSHFGARPEHALWQGGVYSMSGTNHDYPSLVEATDYGDVTGLCGINCRHYIIPYVEGYSQLQDRTFASQQKYFGMTNDQYYAVQQRQRNLEAAVRKYKRRISLLEETGTSAAADYLKLAESQVRLQQLVREYNLPRAYMRERAYGVTKQPREYNAPLYEYMRLKAEGSKNLPSYKGITEERLVGLAAEQRVDIFDQQQVDTVRKYMNAEYLKGGKAPTYSYANEKWKKNCENDPDHWKEIETAKKINKIGYETVFVEDRIDMQNGETIGLFDLENGLEIKNITGGFGRIEERLEKVHVKNGATGAVVDFTLNEKITEPAEKILQEVHKRATKYGIKFVLCIMQNGAIFTIYT